MHRWTIEVTHGYDGFGAEVKFDPPVIDMDGPPMRYLPMPSIGEVMAFLDGALQPYAEATTGPVEFVRQEEAYRSGVGATKP